MGGRPNARKAPRVVASQQDVPPPIIIINRKGLSNSHWLTACLLGTTMLLPLGATGQTWVGTTGTYESAANWTPATVPSGAAATATFSSTGTSTITVGGFHNAGAFAFDSSAQAYTFTIASSATLVLEGAGITNNSGQTQTFVLSSGSSRMSFDNSATAGDAHLQLSAGLVFFNDASSAGTAVIDINGGAVQLADTASLANAKVSVTSGSVILSGSSKGDQAQLSLGAGTTLSVLTSGATDMGSISGTGTIFFGTDVQLKVGANGQSTTYGGKIDGSGVRGSIEKAGTGTWTLTGSDHTYTGSTTISGGRLSLSGAGSLANSSGIDLTNFTATFDISGASGDRTIKDLSGVDGSTVSLGSRTLTVGTANNTTFAGLISGLGGLTKQGSGTLTLSGSNFYLGVTKIDGGTLALSGFGDIDLSSGVDLAAATSVFDISGASSGRTIKDLTGVTGSKVILGGNTLSVGASNSTTFAGTIEGTGGLLKQGSGTLILSGTNTYQGGTAINAGTLSVSSTANLGDAAGTLTFGGGTLRTTADIINSRATTLNGGGGTFDVAVGTTLTQDSVIDGSGGLTKAGDGTLVLSVANTYGGGTTINAGTLSISSDDRLGNGGGLAFGGGTLRTTGSTTTSRATTLNSGGGTFDTSPGTTLTHNGVISGAGGLIKTGAGTLVLGNFLNAYQGGTTIKEGTLSVSENSGLGQAGTALTFDGGTLQATVTGFLLSRAVTLNSGGGTLETVSSVNLILDGVVDGAGRLTKTGAGTLFLGRGNTYQGGTTISSGVLSVSADDRLGNASGDLTFAGGTLRTTLTFATSRATTLDSGGGTFDTATFTTLTHDGVISGAGSLTKSGGGTLVLGGIATYSGVTTISDGTLALTGAGSIASSTGVDLTGVFARFDISGSGADRTIKDMSGVTGSKVILGARTLTVGTSNSTTFSGIVEGSGGLVKQGSGILTLAGVNTYTGATTIAGGTLALSGTGSIASSMGVALMDATARFDISSSSADVTIGDLSGVSGSRVVLGNNGLALGTSNSTTFSGIVEGNGGLAKQGTGALTLEGANTYTGGTTFRGGVIAVSNDGNLGDANGGLTFNGGTLQLLTGFNLATTRTITLDAGGGTIDTGNFNTTIVQGIGGAGGLAKKGSGTLSLEGANVYGGVTAIDSGTLALIGGGSIGASSRLDLTAATARFDISGSGTSQTIQGLSGVTDSKVILGANSLAVGASSSATFGGVIEGTGGLTKQGTGTQTLVGANTYTGATTINGGTLALAGAGSIAASSGVSLADPTSRFDISGSSGDRTIQDLTGVANSRIVLGGNSLTVGTSASTIFGGVIEGSGGITKQGSGTLTLWAESTYSGATTINQGTLALAFDGALANSSVVTVAAGAAFDIGGSGSAVSIRSLAGAGAVQLDTTTLRITNASTEFSGTITGSGLGGIQITGGTQTLSGTLAYIGTTWIERGATLALKGTGSVGFSDKIGFSSTGSGVATFDISQTTTGASVFRLDDAAGNGIVSLGARTLTLTNGASTFNGVVQDGGLGGGVGGGLSLAANTELNLGGASTYAGTTSVGQDAILRLTGNGSIDSSGVDLGGARATFDIAGASGNRAIGNLTGVSDSKVVLGANNLTVGTSNSTTFSGIVEGGGGLIKQGSGTLTLEGASTYTGATTVSIGILALAGGGTISSSSVVTIASGATLDIGGGSADSSIKTLAGAGAVQLGARKLLITAGSTEFSGTITNGNSGGSLEIRGGTQTLSGTIDLQGSTVFLGPVAIHDGTLALKGAGSMANAAVDFAGVGTAVFDISQTTNGASIVGLFDSSGVGGIVALGAKELKITGYSPSFSGVIQDGGIGAGTGGSLRIANGAVQTLNGANAYTGATIVEDGGFLYLQGNGSIATSNSLTLEGNASFDVSGVGAPSTTVRNLSGSGASNVFLDGKDLIVVSSTNTTFSGTIEPFGRTGGLTKEGAAALTLAGINTYVGTTTISAGTLALMGSGDISNSSVVSIASGATFDVSLSTLTNVNVRSLAGSGTVQLGSQILAIMNAAGEFAGSIVDSANGSLQIWSGTMTLTGASTYRGATQVSPGATLALKGAGSILSTSPVSFSTGIAQAIFDISQTTAGASVGSLAATARNGIVNLGSRTLTLTSGAATFFGVLQDGGLGGGTGGGLTLAANVQQELGGTNTYTGATTIGANAVLKVIVTGSIATSSVVNLTGTGATLDISGGNNQTLRDLQGVAGSMVILGGRTLRVGTSNSTTFAGVISGTGSFAKQGSGTLTLTGANNYMGGTTVSGGTLAGDTTSLQGNILNNAAVVFNQVSNGTYSGIMSGSGVFTKSGNGTLILTANNTYSGVTTISGGVLQLGNGGTAGVIAGNVAMENGAVLAFNRADDITFAGNISGDGAVGYMGPGIVTLTGINTYSGGTTILAATVLAGSDDAFGAAGTRVTLAGGTIQATASFTSTRPVTLTGTGGTFDTSGNELTLQGVITGAGALTKTGAGTLILGGTNDYSGGTTVSAGVLQGTTSSLQGDITNNATVVFDQASGGDYAGIMSGSGSLTKNGIGTVILIGANTYTGGTTINAGTLTLSGAGSISNSSLVTVGAGATFDVVGSALPPAVIQNLAGSGTVQFSGRGLEVRNASGEFAGTVAGNGSLFVTGGTMTLSGVSTYDGGTEIARGATLALKGAGSIANSLYIGFALTGGGAGVFDISQTTAGASIRGLADTLAIGIVNLGGKTLTITNGAGTFAGVLRDGGLGGGTGGGLTLAAPAELTLTGLNTYTGATTVGADATLRLAGTGSIASSSRLNLAADGAMFDIFDSSINQTIRDLEGAAGSVVRMRIGLAVGTSNSTTFGGRIVGTGSFTKQGSGTLTLTGASTYTGGTVVNDGVLRLGAGGSLASGRALTVNGGTFDLNGRNQTVGALSGTGGVIVLGSGTLTANSASDTVLAAAITGTGRFVKQGSGTLTLTGANTYTGGTTVMDGTLQGTTTSLQGNIVNNANVVFNQSSNGTYAGTMSGSGALTVTGGGNLTLTGTNTYSGGTTVSAGILTGNTTSLQGDIVNNSAVVFNQTTSDIYAGVMSGTGNLTKTGAGTLILTANNTYTGGTIITGGILQLGNGGTTGMIAGDVINNGVLAFNRSDNVVFAGNISGSGSIAYMGPGTVTLTGSSSYTGGTAISGGTVQAGSDSAFGAAGTTLTVVGGTIQATASFTIARPITLTTPGGTFDTNGNTLTLQGAISGTGGLTKTGAGTLVLAGTNSYSGGTTVTAGILQGTTSSLQGNIVNNAAVVFNQSTAGTYAGNMSGTGGLSVTGSGNVTLTGTNSYSGGTTVSGGTLTGTTSSLQSNILNNAAVVFDQSMDGTYAGNMTGTGGLTKSGSGNVTLTGSNSYTGGTTVSGGTLTGTTTSLQGNIVNNATVVFDQAINAGAITLGTGALTGGSTTLAGGILNGGIISSTGILTKAGSGTLALIGANTYSGGTTVSAAAMVTSGTNTYTGGTTIMSGFLSDGIYAGIMSGSGALTKTGSGVLTLMGSNSYSGGTTVVGGVLQGTTSSLQGNVLNNAVVAFSQSTDGTYTGTMSGTGSLAKTGWGNLTLTGTNTYTGGTTVSGGTLTGNATSLQGTIVNNAALVFDQATNGTYAGAMSGTGSLAKTGAGQLILTGNNVVGGGTTVSAGLLTVNGSLTSSVVVGSGGMIGGSGTIIGQFASNGGTLAPGNSIGTLNVTGNFSQTGGIYQVEVNSGGQSDNIVASGTATIGGGATVQVLAASGTYQRNTTYTIVTATGGLTGTYSGVTSNLAFLTPSLSYDANNVYLLLEQAASAFASGAQTRNQYAVGTALDIASPTATGDFATVLTALASLDTQQGPAALNTISGQPYTGFGTVNVGASLVFMNTLGQQVAQARNGSGPGTTRVALAEACVAACDSQDLPKWGAWISGLGGFGSVGGNTNAGTLTYNLGGAAVGVDYRLDPRFLVGLAVGYSSGRQWVNGFMGNGNADTYSAALYASFNQGGLYVDALAGYAYSDNRMQRVMAIPGLATRIASGQTGANQFLGQIEAGYRMGLLEAAQATLTPFVRFQTVAVSQNGFTESGAQSLNLGVAQQNTTSVRTVIGADLGANIPVGMARPLGVTIRLGWAHEYADTSRPMTAAFAGAPAVPFTVYGAQPLRDAAVIGLGLNAQIGASTSIYARYDGEITGRDDTHAISAGFRMTW
jgi:fibronectin-binding autotransporter adhesin